MTIAKGLSSGYLPIGGVMVGDRVAEVIIDKGGEFAHGFTYSGHPAACAVASVNLTLIQQESLVTRTHDETGPYLAKKWRDISEHPLVGEARSVGLIGALELVKDKGTRTFFDNRGEVGTICRDFCFENGLIMRAVRDTMIISPPLVITPRADRRAGREGLEVPGPDLRPLQGGGSPVGDFRPARSWGRPAARCT